MLAFSKHGIRMIEEKVPLFCCSEFAYGLQKRSRFDCFGVVPLMTSAP